MDGRTLLILDDDPAMGRMLSEALLDAGWRATATTSLRLALHGLRARTFAAVLSDIEMPEAGGFDVLRAVQESAHPIPVILMSGRGDHETSRSATEAGAAGFLAKPFQIAELLALLDGTCRAMPSRVGNGAGSRTAFGSRRAAEAGRDARRSSSVASRSSSSG